MELEARGEAPDLVLSADPGAEKPETYAYQEMMAAWMAARGIPYEIVRYVPRRLTLAALLLDPGQCAHQRNASQHQPGPT